ncbi:hypothetical protein [Variovorax paradoxus]|uniref:hypothetical protein n=1 Tax=Variovorax paradoxus TaxID=34073 RepID=UPI003D65B5A0
MTVGPVHHGSDRNDFLFEIQQLTGITHTLGTPRLHALVHSKTQGLTRERLIQFGKEGAGPVAISMDIGYIKLVVSHAADVHRICVQAEPVDLARIALADCFAFAHSGIPVVAFSRAQQASEQPAVQGVVDHSGGSQPVGRKVFPIDGISIQHLKSY